METAKIDWEKAISTAEEKDRLAMQIYSTHDYFMTGWETCKHGVVILDEKGIILDVNPFFAQRLNYLRSELIGRHIESICDKPDDLIGCDNINITTLLHGGPGCEQISSKCNVETNTESQEDTKLWRVHWVAHRIPRSREFEFVHSVVHVYFIDAVYYNKIKTLIDETEKKNEETTGLWNSASRFCRENIVMLIIVIVFAALNGTLGEILKNIIGLFGN